MDIVEKLRLVDCTFWYKPLGHGIDTDLDVPAYELGALSHEAADEIERLREVRDMLQAINEAKDKEIAILRAEKHLAALKEGE